MRPDREIRKTVISRAFRSTAYILFLFYFLKNWIISSTIVFIYMLDDWRENRTAVLFLYFIYFLIFFCLLRELDNLILWNYARARAPAVRRDLKSPLDAKHSAVISHISGHRPLPTLVTLLEHAFGWSNIIHEYHPWMYFILNLIHAWLTWASRASFHLISSYHHRSIFSFYIFLGRTRDSFIDFIKKNGKIIFGLPVFKKKPWYVFKYQLRGSLRPVLWFSTETVLPVSRAVREDAIAVKNTPSTVQKYELQLGHWMRFLLVRKNPDMRYSARLHAHERSIERFVHVERFQLNFFFFSE